jgi:hypothetical protein
MCYVTDKVNLIKDNITEVAKGESIEYKIDFNNNRMQVSLGNISIKDKVFKAIHKVTGIKISEISTMGKVKFQIFL